MTHHKHSFFPSCFFLCNFNSSFIFFPLISIFFSCLLHESSSPFFCPLVKKAGLRWGEGGGPPQITDLHFWNPVLFFYIFSSFSPVPLPCFAKLSSYCIKSPIDDISNSYVSIITISFKVNVSKPVTNPGKTKLDAEWTLLTLTDSKLNESNCLCFCNGRRDIGFDPKVTIR